MKKIVDIPLCVLRPVTIKKNNKTIWLKSVDCEAFNAGFFSLIDESMLKRNVFFLISKELFSVCNVVDVL